MQLNDLPEVLQSHLHAREQYTPHHAPPTLLVPLTLLYQVYYVSSVMSYPWLWTHIPTLMTYGRTSPNTFQVFLTLPNHFQPLPTLCELLRSFVNLGSPS